MVGWIIVLILALFFLLIWLMKVGVSFSYQKKMISFQLKIGWLSITILPKKEKSERQKLRAQARKEKRQAKEKKKPDAAPAPPSYDRKELLLLFIPDIKPLLERLGKALYLDQCFVSLVFGLSDPYQTAVAYGAIHALFAQIWALMEQHLRMNDVHIHLEPDFTAPTFRAEGSVLATMRVGKGMVIAFWLLLRLLKHYRTAQRMYQEKLSAEPSQATPEPQAAS